jgi:hypothetical protein
MPLPPRLDQDKLAEAALAILSLTVSHHHGGERAWKGFDWDLLSLLHKKGWIDDPVSKAKSVLLTEEGARVATQLLHRHFGKMSSEPDAGHLPTNRAKARVGVV